MKNDNLEQNRSAEEKLDLMKNPHKMNLFNIAAEQIVLGAIILNNEYLGKVIEFLNKIHFYEPAHQIIFEHVVHLKQKLKITADSITLKNFFDNNELLKTIGGSKYLSILLSMGAGIVDIVDYAKIIQDLFTKRRLVLIGEIIVNDAYKKANKITALTQIENASNELFELQKDIGIENDLEYSVESYAQEIHDQICCLEDPQYRLRNIIRTGFKAFDVGDPSVWNSKFEGFFKDDLVILAGKSSMGKTTYALNIALNVLEQKKTVAFFSLEMSKKSLIQKILANKTRINSRIIRARNLTKSQHQECIERADELSREDLHISDKSGINPSYIERNLKKITKMIEIYEENGEKKERFKKVDLVVIDYLQKMTPNKKGWSKSDAIGSITGELKGIAKKFNCCVLCLSQLNRKLDGRDDKIPRLDDLRDSGEIEQDADVVLFAYRKVYYLQQELSKLNIGDENYDTEFRKLNCEISKIRNDCRLLVRKNRNGVQYGDIKLSFYPEYSIVEDRIRKDSINPYKGFRR